jgi:hypothetical protein
VAKAGFYGVSSAAVSKATQRARALSMQKVEGPWPVARVPRSMVLRLKSQLSVAMRTSPAPRRDSHEPSTDENERRGHGNGDGRSRQTKDAGIET